MYDDFINTSDILRKRCKMNSIYGIYIAPLQGNYSEALPAQAKRKVLRQCMNVSIVKLGDESQSKEMLYRASVISIRAIHILRTQGGEVT